MCAMVDMYHFLAGRRRKQTLKMEALQICCFHLKLYRLNIIEITGLGPNIAYFLNYFVLV
jgi:hypothetical protein